MNPSNRHFFVLVVGAIFWATTMQLFAQPNQNAGIWISRAEIMALPMSGPAWQKVKSEADRAVVTPDLSDQDDKGNIRALAKALVYVRTGEQRYRSEAREMIFRAIGTEDRGGGDVLGLVRNLGALVVAADLIGLDSQDRNEFVSWLVWLRPHVVEGRYSIETASEQRPNNWGGHANFARVTLDAYIGDWDDLDETAIRVRSFLGEPDLYTKDLGKGWIYGDDLSWQPDPANPVGVVQQGVTLHGHDVSGMIPDDQRRCGKFQWPPCKTGYLWETLQGWVATAVVLHRYGYDAFNWSNQAIRRCFDYLHNTTFSDGRNYPAEGDDTWLPHLANYFYGTNYPAPVPSRAGKNMGFTDWTHATPGDRGSDDVILKIKIEGMGRVDVSPPGYIYSRGTQVTVTAVAEAGWAFSGWGGALSGSANPTQIVLQADEEIVAIFQALAVPQYTLNLNVVGSGSVDLSPPGGVYDAGTQVALSARPASGWEFSAWGGDLAGNDNPIRLEMNADKNVIANFSQQAPVDTTSTLAGQVIDALTTKPIVQARAVLRRNGQEYQSTKTDSAGAFAFNRIAAATYTLVCTKQGYKTHAEQITTAPGQIISSKNIELVPAVDNIAPAAPTNVQVHGVSN